MMTNSRYIRKFRIGPYELMHNKFTGDWRLRNWRKYLASKNDARMLGCL